MFLSIVFLIRNVFDSGYREILHLESWFLFSVHVHQTSLAASFGCRDCLFNHILRARASFSGRLDQKALKSQTDSPPVKFQIRFVAEYCCNVCIVNEQYRFGCSDEQALTDCVCFL